MTTIEQRIENILEQLDQTNEDLLALSDDIWLSIDHNDNQALREALEFKKDYNQNLTQFNHLSEEISNLVEDYTGLSTDDEQTSDIDTEENERRVKALDKRKKHFLDEDFKYKRPYGFTIKGKAYQNVKTWQKVYKLTLDYFYNTQSNFESVLSASEFISNRGNKDFSKSKTDLRKGLKVVSGLFAEANLSANQISNRILKLLHHFGIDKNEFVVYLREDRDWKIK